jgi:hypothetical protein
MIFHGLPSDSISSLKGRICLRLANEYLDSIRAQHPMSDEIAMLIYSTLTDQLLEHATDRDMLELLGLAPTSQTEGIK